MHKLREIAEECGFKEKGRKTERKCAKHQNLWITFLQNQKKILAISTILTGNIQKIDQIVPHKLTNSSKNYKL